jgi:CBS domain-containing protein
MRVKDAMCREVVAVGPEATLQEAADRMRVHHVKTLLVMEEGVLVGVIGLRDLFTTPRPASYGGRMTERHSEEALLESWRSSHVRMQMNDQPLVVSEELPLLAAAALMVNGGKHPLPVLRDGQVVGVISRSDIVAAVLELNPPAEADEQGQAVASR